MLRDYTVIRFIFVFTKFRIRKAYENFLHENCAQDRDTLIEQSI